MSGTENRRLPAIASIRGVAVLFAALGVQQANAGLFDDEEARRQVSELTVKLNERLDTAARGQMELASQIQALRDETARLRGQVETLTYELDSVKKRQQDFYVDLDGRLRKIEAPAPTSVDAKTTDDGKPASEPPRKVASDPAA